MGTCQISSTELKSGNWWQVTSNPFGDVSIITSHSRSGGSDFARIGSIKMLTISSGTVCELRYANHCDLALSPWPELNSLYWQYVCDRYFKGYLMTFFIVYTSLSTCHANIITVVHIVMDRIKTTELGAWITDITASEVWYVLRWCIFDQIATIASTYSGVIE